MCPPTTSRFTLDWRATNPSASTGKDPEGQIGIGIQFFDSPHNLYRACKKLYEEHGGDTLRINITIDPETPDDSG